MKANLNLGEALEKRIADYISANNWKWARTYINVPHEYIVRDKCTLTKQQFDEFVETQRNCGITERWGNYNHQYLYIGGYKYWTMGAPIDETTVINRQKLFGEFDDLVNPLAKWYTVEFRNYIAEIVNSIRGEKNVYEAYCGDGDFVAASHISSSQYKGAEPSNVLINAFREKQNGFYRNVTKSPFESLSERWTKPGTLVISLFGKASYIMRPYLEKVVSSGNDYFFMFFKDGELPTELEGTHTIGYTQQEIKEMFPKSNRTIMKDEYYVVTNKKIKW